MQEKLNLEKEKQKQEEMNNIKEEPNIFTRK